jgi:hypothetical protein
MGLVASSDVAHARGRAKSAVKIATRARGIGGDMAKLWYVSVASASTVVAPRFMRGFGHLFWVSAGLLASFGAAGCAAPSASGASRAAVEPAAAPSVPTEAGARGANLAGARCHGPGAACTCRVRAQDPRETSPPDAGHKRFEIRVGAGGGPATFSSPTLGDLSSVGGAGESCFYVDVVPGTTHEVSFVAREAKAEEGVSPVLEIAEYGAKGPWWYDVLLVKCDGPGGHCNREAADAWSADAKSRRRGRVDPCGSSVITHLRWDTSGGTGNRELGVFQDFTVAFTMEVKKFATQFAPGSTECVPK